MNLCVVGGSNGGLLMGAALTQHPELVRAVVSEVGIYDMLRMELFPNGMFNTTEYGSVKDPDQFRALYAYSPYHHVRDGVKYPAVMISHGLNDPRVEPWESANGRYSGAALAAVAVGTSPGYYSPGSDTSMDAKVRLLANYLKRGFAGQNLSRSRKRRVAVRRRVLVVFRGRPWGAPRSRRPPARRP